MRHVIIVRIHDTARSAALSVQLRSGLCPLLGLYIRIVLCPRYAGPFECAISCLPLSEARGRDLIPSKGGASFCARSGRSRSPTPSSHHTAMQTTPVDQKRLARL
jgi:hypothetical protein